jgi:hypothetical protein
LDLHFWSDQELDFGSGYSREAVAALDFGTCPGEADADRNDCYDRVRPFA